VDEGFRFCGLGFAVRIHWLKSMMISGEKEFVWELILSAATPVAYNPATLQGKRRLQSLWQRDARKTRNNQFRKGLTTIK
jgi:hypothetical protein